MKAIILSIVLTLIITHSSFSQTKWIAHRSHSGAKESFFMDKKLEMFGPGEMPMNMRINANIPIHNSLILKFELYQSIHFPIVKINWDALSLHFINDRDSIITFEQSFTEFLPKGAIVYNIEDKQYYLYNYQFKEKLIQVTDSIDLWKEQGNIRYLEDFIQSKNYGEIWFNYPRLTFNKVDELVKELKLPVSPVKEKRKRKEKKCTKPVESDTLTPTPKVDPAYPILINDNQVLPATEEVDKNGIQPNYRILFLLGILFALVHLIFQSRVKIEKLS